MYKNSLVSLRNMEAQRSARRKGLGARYKQENQRRIEDIQRAYMEIFREPVERRDADFIGKEYLMEPETGSDLAPTKSLLPRGREDIAPEEIKNDPEWQAELKKLREQYGFEVGELYRLIQGESGFRPTATNPSGAEGLFQFIPKVTEELGYTPGEIKNMTPAQQLSVYGKYLDRWGYDGRNSLSILHAAPAFANASPDTVVYPKGSVEWEQNPPWRPEDGGDITVESINRYYR